jgi:phosphoribosylformylglycinamidine synthase
MTTGAHAVRITVRLDPAVNDPQGNAVGEGLRALGHEVRDVRVGKVIELLVEASDTDEALERADRMCRELLANPVIETWEVDVVEVAGIA